MYRVIQFFTDLQDGNHEYHVGDVFPRMGIHVTPKRLEELLTNKNKQHKPLIESFEQEEIREEKAEEPRRGRRKKG